MPVPEFREMLERRTDWRELRELLAFSPRELQKRFSIALDVQRICDKPSSRLEYDLVHATYHLDLSPTGHARIYVFGAPDPYDDSWTPHLRFDEFYPQSCMLENRGYGTFAMAATLRMLEEKGIVTGDFRMGYPAQTSGPALHRLASLGLASGDTPRPERVGAVMEAAIAFAESRGFSPRDM